MKKRNSNIELLRIISMFLIVVCHFVNQTEFTLNNSIINIFFIKLFGTFGRLSVNIFVIISAWFLIDKPSNFKKIIKLYGQVLFYSLFFLILFAFFIKPYTSINFFEIIRSVFPFVFGQYWFFTCYILMLIFSPYLNIMINSIPIKDFKKFLIIFSIIIIFIEGLFPQSLPNVFSLFMMFIYIYFFMSYVKKHLDLLSNSIKNNILKAVLLFIVETCFIGLFIAIGNVAELDFFITNAGYFGKINSIFTFGIALQLFLIFIKIKPFSCKIINVISSTTFGVYLIHENIFVRPYIWNVLVHNDVIITSSKFILLVFPISICIFLICSIIDIVRQKIISKIWNKLIEFVLTPFVRIIKKIYMKIDLNKIIN